jgi:predicted nucleic acid-binding Zn ribbon protein
MRRRNAESIGTVLQHFYDENPQLKQKLLEMRIIRAWNEMPGKIIAQSTRSLYVKNRVLYVSVSSSVLRNELLLHRENLVKKLNGCARAEVIRDIVIR